MKKRIVLSAFALLIIIFSSFSNIIYAKRVHCETTPYNWYFKKNLNHCPPPLPCEFSFIEKYDCYYLDKKAKDEKVIYLTFDAGYENGNVEKVLDTLKKHNVPAAFFILDNLIYRNCDLVKRMANEGHIVANHTKNHPDMTKIEDKDKFEKQLKDLADLYKEKIGKEMPKYYRPPEGRFSEQNLRYAKELGYKTIFWSFAYADWDNGNQPCPEKALKKILAHTHNGEVLLLHPTSSTNAAILDELITTLKKQGYRFGTLDELTK